MKTQIIHLDPHDDVASVQDKITWSKAQHLILIWPGRSRVLTSKLDLRLVQRHAARRNAKIGVVSLDPDVQLHARSLNIPVFDDLTDLPEDRWSTGYSPVELLEVKTAAQNLDHDNQLPGPRLSSDPMVPQPLRVTLFILAITITLVSAALLLPTAEISVDPARQIEEENFILSIDGGIESGTPSANSTSLREDRFRLDGSLRKATSGVNFEPGDFAQGQVKFTNLTDEAITIPAQSTVRVPDSDQLYFITQSRLRIPAGSGESRVVDILASLPGTGGNVGAGQITAVDGSLGLLVAVENPEPTTGGSVILRNAVAASDLSQVRDLLSQQLLSQAKEIISANLLAEEELLISSLEIQEILSEDFDRRIGDTADTVGLQMNVIARAYIANHEILSNELEDKLGSNLDANFQVVPNSLSVQSVELTEKSGETSSEVSSTVAYETYFPIDLVELSAKIRGLRREEALLRLEKTDTRTEFEIQIYPTWYPLLPIFQQQITFNYAWETQR